MAKWLDKIWRREWATMAGPAMVYVRNDGKHIIETNYYDTTNARGGYVYLSLNAGAFRLLIPDTMVGAINEMRTAHEVIVSRGPWPDDGRPDALEIMFEDGSDSPYTIHLVPQQCDMMPDHSWRARESRLLVYNRAGLQLDLPAFYRSVKRVPWLKKYNK